MEDNIYAFDAYLVRPWREWCTRTELEVSQQSIRVRLRDNEFDRYRKVATFGRGTIRRFHKNASAMKRLAARDYEDLLQVNGFSLRSQMLKFHL